MQQIQLKEPPPCPATTLYLDNLCKYDLQGKIICYVTKCHNECNDDGIGVLIEIKRATYRTNWGFRYHRSLVSRDDRDLTFKGDTGIEAIENCLSKGRAVYQFEKYKEFLEFAMTHGAY